MNESKKTIIFAGVALGIALLAFITTPRRVTPDAFLDKGELFFPDFADPNDATTLAGARVDDLVLILGAKRADHGERGSGGRVYEGSRGGCPRPTIS